MLLVNGAGVHFMAVCPTLGLMQLAGRMLWIGGCCVAMLAFAAQRLAPVYVLFA